jgi:uncharacterized protein (TIGR02266 family)
MFEDKNKQRRHRRIAVHMPVRISTIDPETDPRTGRPYFRATREYCANLSRGGVFIRTTDPLSPGRRVLVEIHMPEGEPVEAVGRVAWSKTVLTPSGDREDSGVGVEFLGSSGDQLTALADYLEIAPEPTKLSKE